MPLTTRTRTILTEIRDLLLILQKQTVALLDRVDEQEESLRRIACAAEKTAARAFWIALPVYLSLAAALVAGALWIISLLIRR